MTVLLTGGRLIDGTGREPLDDAALLIDEGRVREVGHAREVVAPPDATVIDVAGKTILPGLIDCHDHMAATGFDKLGRLAAPASLTMMKVAQTLRLTLETGFTTIRDAGGLDAGFKMAIEQGIIPGPRLVVSLVILCRTGGIYDPRLPTGFDLGLELPGLPWPICDGAEECRKRVREVIHAGADVIKCASTGGVSSPTLTAVDPTFTYEELRVIVEEARALGRRTMVHAYGGPGLVAAVEAGIDSIEHGAYLCETPELLDRMAAEGQYLVPTFMVLEHHRERGTPFAREKAAAMRESHIRTLEMAMAKGVPVAMGTDGGPYVHGQNAFELELMVEAGMTPMQSIVASTKTAAECLGLGAEVGTLEAGKYADLIVVDGDPLADITLLRQPERFGLVMKEGVAYVDRLGSSTQALPPSS